MSATVEKSSLTDKEREMFLEIAEVMERHSKETRRFNLALDHQHFPISEDEVLFEMNDPKNRVLKSVVVKTDVVPQGSLASQWSIQRIKHHSRPVLLGAWMQLNSVSERFKRVVSALPVFSIKDSI